MRNLGALVPSALILAALACFNACQQNPQKPAVAHGTLPPPPVGQLKYAGTPPAHPFARQAGNYYARTAFETDGPDNSHIEVRDVLIPPRSKSAVAALPGPAILDLATGTATILTGDKPETLAVGTMRSVPPNQVLQFENPDSRPAIVRLYVIRGR